MQMGDYRSNEAEYEELENVKNKNNRSSYEQQMLKSVSNRMRVTALVYLGLRDLCLVCVCVSRIFIHGIWNI